MRCMILVFVVACGDNAAGPVPEIADAGCRQVPFTNLEAFGRSSDLPPVVGYSLEGADLSGRWFMTEAYLGSSSLVLAKTANGYSSSRFQFPASSTELFGTFAERPQPGSPNAQFGPFRFTERIANLREDGSLRYDQVLCREETDTCQVCTARMIRAERHDPTESKNLSLVAELAPEDLGFEGQPLDVIAFGGMAYVVGFDGLAAVDVADPALPAVRGKFYDPDRDTRSNDVVIFEVAARRYAVIADSPVKVVDVTNPDDLRPAGQLPVEAHTLYFEERGGVPRVYFGSLDGTCPVWDFSDPLHPVRVGAFDAQASYVHDLSVADGIAYLNAWEKGFFVVDYTDPAQPKELGHWPAPLGASHANVTLTAGNGRRIAVHGEETYGAHLTVIDIDPASPQFMQPLAEWETRAYVSIHNFVGAGTKAYVTYYQDGVRVLDFADPTRPTERGYFNTWDPADPGASTDFFAGAIGLDLDLARRLIFVADLERGLLILRDET